MAIETTGEIINSLEADSFEEFFELLKPLLQKRVMDPENMQFDKHEKEIEEEREKKTLLLKLHVTIFKAVGLSWPSSSFEKTQRNCFNQVFYVLSSSLPNNNWKIQVAILKSLMQILKRYVEGIIT